MSRFTNEKGQIEVDEAREAYNKMLEVSGFDKDVYKKTDLEIIEWYTIMRLNYEDCLNSKKT